MVVSGHRSELEYHAEQATVGFGATSSDQLLLRRFVFMVLFLSSVRDAF